MSSGNYCLLGNLLPKFSPLSSGRTRAPQFPSSKRPPTPIKYTAAPKKIKSQRNEVPPSPVKLTTVLEEIESPDSPFANYMMQAMTTPTTRGGTTQFLHADTAEMHVSSPALLDSVFPNELENTTVAHTPVSVNTPPSKASHHSANHTTGSAPNQGDTQRKGVHDYTIPPRKNTDVEAANHNEYAGHNNSVGLIVIKESRGADRHADVLEEDNDMQTSAAEEIARTAEATIAELATQRPKLGTQTETMGKNASDETCFFPIAYKDLDDGYIHELPLRFVKKSRTCGVYGLTAKTLPEEYQGFVLSLEIMQQLYPGYATTLYEETANRDHTGDDSIIQHLTLVATHHARLLASMAGSNPSTIAHLADFAEKNVTHWFQSLHGNGNLKSMLKSNFVCLFQSMLALVKKIVDNYCHVE